MAEDANCSIDVHEDIGETVLSKHEQLQKRLDTFKNISCTTIEIKKSTWLSFLCLWSDVTAFSYEEATEYYEQSCELLKTIFKTVGFYVIKRDPAITMKSVITGLDMLNRAHMKQYLQIPSEKEDTATNHIYFVHVSNMLWFVSQAFICVPCTLGEIQQQIQSYLDLFRLLTDRVDKSMPDKSLSESRVDLDLGVLNTFILSLLWNSVDLTVLVPFFIQCDLPRKVVSWLKNGSMLQQKARRPFISIIHNLSRHDDGVDRLNECNAIPIIKEYQTKVTKDESEGFIAAMALALLSTPEQIRSDRKGMNAVLNRLLQIVINAAKVNGHRSNSFHVSEPLMVLVKLFVVEERTLDYVLCHAETVPPCDTISTIRLFVKLLIDFAGKIERDNLLGQFTVIALLNILWSISFQANYASELKQNQDLINIIQSFMKNEKRTEILAQYQPRSMENFQQAASGILHNLHLEDHDPTRSVEQETEKRRDEQNISKSSIMISYCHADNVFCTQIFDLFTTYNEAFEIWIDRTHCQGATDLWEAIADGMEKSSVIVSLLSEKYFESKSCRQEFIYAIDSLKKPVIPVLIGDFEPKGWLGIRMSGLKYIRFRDQNQLDSNKLTELSDTVRSYIPTTKNPILKTIQPLIQHHSPKLTKKSTSNTTTAPSTPMDQWSSSDKDIETWFNHHKISSRLGALFNFQSREEMLDYAALIEKDHEKQMNIYAKIYSQKYSGEELPPHEFLRFVRALEQLTKSNPRSEQNNLKQKSSSVCVIF